MNSPTEKLTYIESLLKRKPNLKLFPNHRKYKKRVLRYWNSSILGTAICDGNGWYIQKGRRRL